MAILTGRWCNLLQSPSKPVWTVWHRMTTHPHYWWFRSFFTCRVEPRMSIHKTDAHTIIRTWNNKSSFPILSRVPQEAEKKIKPSSIRITQLTKTLKIKKKSRVFQRGKQSSFFTVLVREKKILWQKQPKEKGIILVFSPRGIQSIMRGRTGLQSRRAGWPEQEAGWSHCI